MEIFTDSGLVVLVDDDEGIREAFADVLESEGYEVLSFPNGREALEGLDSLSNPCLILLDWMMPVMNGQQFLEARRGVLRDSTVVVLSAITRHLARRMEGVAALVEKPVDFDKLVELVRHHSPKSA